MIGIIVQARTGSTRLPDKILKEIINESSLIEYLLQNLHMVTNCKTIIVATTENPNDNRLVETLKKRNTLYFRGSENDVRKRYIEAAEAFNVDTIIRIPSDNPFTIPSLIDELIEYWNKNSFDYISTTLSETFPIGTHVEIFRLDALKKTLKICTDLLSIEHVTPCIYNNGMIFNIGEFKSKKDLSKYRLTVDYCEDLKFARELAKRIGDNALQLDELIALINKEPSLFSINSMHKKKGAISFDAD